MESSDKHPHIPEDAYRTYLSSLLSGCRMRSSDMVLRLFPQVPAKIIYEELFRRSLYEVGELWEFNKISVAVEHLATAITEGIMNQMYPQLISPERSGRKIVVSCLEQEFHQIGGKTVADIFETHGWDSFYLGANTPVRELIRFLHETTPDLVGISLSVYFHINCLHQTIRAIRKDFPTVGILIGGQAFRFGGKKIADSYPYVRYSENLDDLENLLREWFCVNIPIFSKLSDAQLESAKHEH